jgi:hypothetical protein
MLYGRELLLHGEKRNAVLDLPEIHRFGIDSYGDANYVSIYGPATGAVARVWDSPAGPHGR